MCANKPSFCTFVLCNCSSYEILAISLTIDQGNSSAKLAVWDGSENLCQQSVPTLTPEVVEALIDRFHPSQALVCTVTGNGPKLARWLRDRGIARSLEVRTDMPLPLRIDYRTPQTLGEDRVAAAVGAWSLFPGQTLLVVDMGTAVTYDVVTPDARYHGGNIAPGVGMRLRSLHSFTARLPKVDGYGETPLLGFDTVTAMRAGAIRGVVAEIAYYRSKLPVNTRVVLSGGWSPRISEFLDFPVTIDTSLVTKGLLSILLYNEDK